MTTPPNAGQARRRLAAPTLAPRIADSLSFLYLDMVRVVQDDTGVCAQIRIDEQRTDTVYIPRQPCRAIDFGVRPGTRGRAVPG